MLCGCHSSLPRSLSSYQVLPQFGVWSSHLKWSVTTCCNGNSATLLTMLASSLQPRPWCPSSAQPWFLSWAPHCTRNWWPFALRSLFLWQLQPGVQGSWFVAWFLIICGATSWYFRILLCISYDYIYIYHILLIIDIVIHIIIIYIILIIVIISMYYYYYCYYCCYYYY